MPLVARAHSEEEDEVIALDRACLPEDDPWHPAEDAALFVTRDVAGHVVAFGSCKPSRHWSDAVYLDRAGVAPEARGRGLQLALIRARLRWARRAGYVWAVTDTRDNPHSGNNLIRAGFRLFRPSAPWAHPEAQYWARALRNTP